MRSVLILMVIYGVLCIRSFLPAEAAPEPSLKLENRYLRLTFDPQTGAWTGLTDRLRGDSLVSGPVMNALVAPAGPPVLDSAGLARAVTDGRAWSLEGDWLYTPTPPQESRTAAIRQGRFEGVEWAATPLASRRGIGDDRLHERFGDFWYRREFAVPVGWPAGDLMLVIGAVDDFDVTYVNGTRVGGTGQETPFFWQAPRYYRIPARLLRRDRPNTLLVKVTNGGYDGGIDGPVIVGHPDALSPPKVQGPPLIGRALSRRKDASALALTARSGDWEYRMEYEMPGNRAAFTRQLIVRNLSKDTQTLREVPLSTPPLAVGPAQGIVFPGSLPVGDTPASSLQDGETRASRGMDPLVLLWDAGKKRGLGAWFHSEEEFAPVSARRAGGGVELRHSQQVIVRLKPGESVKLGRQWFWLARGSRTALLDGVQAVYRSIGLRAPSGGMARLCEKTLYCAHPGGTAEMNYRGYGGFRAVEAYLPTLQKMGLDLVWFLPIWEHGDGTVWNLYSPFDHFKVSPLYGTPEDLKSLSAAMRACGMGLLFDLVPHGPPDFTPLAQEHPEWICHDEGGKKMYVWNQYAFDNAHPGWQDYMRRAAANDGREYGAVGARVDCGAGSPPNFNAAVTSRPSISTLGGALGMNRAIREGFLQAGREVVLLPEEYTGANIFYRVADLTYDAQLYFLMADLQARNAAPAEWARDLQRFLHDQQRTLPPGALKMRWISNHDTVSWTFQKARPAKAYGVDRTRALMALCAFVEGVPMLYQGDEDPAVYGGQGVSNVEFLARIYGLRKRLIALRWGTTDYTVRASGGVFACQRATEGQKALVLISFNPAPVESMVALRSLLPASGAWTDAETGERIGRTHALRVRLAPHQARVLLWSDR